MFLKRIREIIIDAYEYLDLMLSLRKKEWVGVGDEEALKREIKMLLDDNERNF